MPTFEVNTPDGQRFEVNAPEGATLQDAFAYVEENLWKPKEQVKRDTGLTGAAKASYQTLKGDVAALAGRAGLMDVEEAEKYQKAQREKASEMFKPTEEGWTEAPWTKFKETLGGSLPYMAAPLAVGAGAVASPVIAGGAALTGTAATIAGLTGAGLTSAAQFTGSNLARQMEEGKSLKDTDLLAAGAAAVPQAALDTLSMKMIPGLGRIFGAVGKKLPEKVLEDIAKQGILKTAGSYALQTGKTAGIEGTTEAAQQFFERLQAGLDIADEKARSEYFDNFIGGAVLGGTLAVPGTFMERARQSREYAEAAAKAKETGEPQVFQLPYDPNVVNTTYGQTPIEVLPDGSTRFASEKLSDAAFAEKYAPQVAPPQERQITEAFADPEDKARIEQARAEEARKYSPAMQKLNEYQRKADALKEQLSPFAKVDPVNGLYLPAVEDVNKELQEDIDFVNNYRSVAQKTADGVKVYDGTLSPNGKRFTTVDENGKKIVLDTTSKNVVVDPSEKDIYKMEAGSLEKQAIDASKAMDEVYKKVKEENKKFADFIKANKINYQYAPEVSADILKPRKAIPYRAKQMFDKEGLGLDDIAVLAHERGFLSDGEFNNPADRYGVNALLSKLTDLYDGNIIETNAVRNLLGQARDLDKSKIDLENEIDRRKAFLAETPTQEQTATMEPVAPSPETQPIEGEFKEPKAERTFEATEKFLAEGEKLAKDLRAALDKMGLKQVGLNLEDSVYQLIEGKMTEVNGNYFQKLIQVSLSGPNIKRTLNHEAIHAMKDLGFFSDSDWKMLSEMASKEWLQKYNVAERYPNLNEEERIEEAVADAFADTQTQPPKVKSLAAKLVDVLKRIGNVLRGRGFKTADDIFEKAATGKLAEGVAQESGKIKTDVTDKFKRWFGDSKVVDENGNPLVVYHGTAGDLFNIFDKQKIRAIDYDTPFNGFWFSSDKNTSPAMRDASNVIPVYLSIKNPAPSDVWRKVSQQVYNEFNSDKRDQALRKDARSVGDEIRYRLQDMGYDGIQYSGAPNVNKKELEETGKTTFQKPSGTWYTLAKNENYGGLDLYSGKNTENHITGYSDINDYLDTEKEQVWVAFEPTQIKSAIGNRGEYSATDADIRAEVKQPKAQVKFEGVDSATAEMLNKRFTNQKATVKEKIEELKPNFFNRIIQGVFDEFHAIKKYSEDAYMKSVLSKSTDGALEGLLFYGQVGLKDGALVIKQGTKGLVDILKPLGAEVDRYQIWKALNRDAQMPAEKRSFTDEEINARHKLIEGSIDGKPRSQVYNTALKEENALNKSVLNIAKEQGLIDDEAYERFSNDIYYIPFYKYMEEDGSVMAVNASSKLTGQYFSKALKGGEKQVNDLMENVLRNWSHILSASMKNKAAVDTLKAAEKLGAAEKVKSTYEGKDAIKVMENGKTSYYTVTDPLLMDSISLISYVGPKSPFLNIAKGFTNMLRTGVTLSPAYKVRNLIRDTTQAASVSDLSLNVLDNISNGLKLSNKNNPTFIQALAGGGVFEMGTAHEGDQAIRIKQLVDQGVNIGNILDTPDKIKGVLSKAYNWYNELGNRFENANRLALYDKLIKEGKTHLQASFAARDLMNFSSQGSFRAIKIVSQVVPFFNARLQGLYKLGRDGITPTYRVLYNTATGKEIDASDRKKAYQFSVVTSAVMMASVMLYMAYKDDEDFQRREAWDRDNFWWFKIDDTIFRIPKPFEIGAAGTLAERITEQIQDESVEGKVFFDRLRAIFSDTFSMNPIPQAFKPMIDLYANKDSFTGAPIESAGLENLSKQERYTDSTSGIAKALGGTSEMIAKVLTLNPDAQGFSPIQMDYAVKAYLGWLGATSVALADKAVQPWSEVEKPSKSMLDLIGVSSFVKQGPEVQSKFVTNFYDSSIRMNQAFADMKRYAEHNEIDKLNELLAEKGDLIALKKSYDAASKQLAQYRKYIQIVTNDKKMDVQDKENEIKRTKVLMSQLAEQMEKARISIKKQ